MTWNEDSNRNMRFAKLLNPWWKVREEKITRVYIIVLNRFE